MYGGASGAAGGVGGIVAGGVGSGALPFTGLGVAELAIAGFVLLAAGQATMRMIPRFDGGKGVAPRKANQRRRLVRPDGLLEMPR